MRQVVSVLFLAALLMIGASSEAAMILYTNKADFLNDTGATSATGALPDVGAVAPGFTVGSVSFTTLSGQFFIGIPPNDWTSLIPGPDIAISDVESFRAELAAPVFSLGFDFNEPTISGGFPNGCHVAVCSDSTFRVTLVLAGVDIPGASFLFNAPDDVLAFIGVWTDFAFDEVRIIDETDTIDDEFWGEFYAGNTPVPEPGSLSLLGAGLLAAALGRRRRR